jgi:GNAT superfamily N-acetyltransferase
MTRLPLEYRLAAQLDAIAVTDLCEEFHGLSYQRSVPFDWDIMVEWVSDRIDDDGSLVLGCWRGSDLVGCVIGLTFVPPYSERVVAGDFIWYVKPKHRGGMVGVRLMKMFEDWAVDAGAAQILTGATSGIKSERGAALLERLGFVPTGTSVYKDLV